MEPQTSDAAALAQDGADRTAPVTTAVQSAVADGDFGKFRAAQRAESLGKPLAPPEPADDADQRLLDRAGEAVSDDRTGKPAERQLSKRQIELNEKIREAVERATAETTAELTRLKAQLAPAASRGDNQTEKPAAAAPADDPEPDPSDATKYPAGEYDPKYLKDVGAHEARRVLKAQQAEREAAQRKDHADAEQLRIAQGWKTKVDAAMEQHPDFKAVALDASTKIPAGGVVDGWILDSPHGALVLYALQKNQAEQTRILALPAYDQIRELVKLEDRLTAAPPTKTVSDTPDPVTTLGTRPADPGDPSRAAVAGGDFTRFRKAEMDKRIAARR